MSTKYSKLLCDSCDKSEATVLKLLYCPACHKAYKELLEAVSACLEAEHRSVQLEEIPWDGLLKAYNTATKVST